MPPGAEWVYARANGAVIQLGGFRPECGFDSRPLRFESKYGNIALGNRCLMQDTTTPLGAIR